MAARPEAAPNLRCDRHSHRHGDEPDVALGVLERAAARPCGRLFFTLSMLLATSSGEATGSWAASTMTSPTLTLFSAAGLVGIDLAARSRPSCLGVEVVLGAQLVGERRQLEADQRRAALSRLAAASGLSLPFGDVLGRALSARPPQSGGRPSPSASCVWPLRSTSTSTVLADRRLRDEARQAAHGRHVLAVELQDDVAGLDAGLGGRAVRRDAGDQRAGVLRDAAGLGDVVGDRLDLDAEPAAARLAELAQLVDDDAWRCRTARRSRCRSSRRSAR